MSRITVRPPTARFCGRAALALVLGGAFLVPLGGCFLKSKEELRQEAAVPPKPLDQQARQHYNEGIVCEQRRQYPEALGEYYQALHLDPKFAAAWMAIGNVHQLQNRYLQAEQAYLKAIAADPTLATAKNNLAWLYYTNRLKLDQAEALALAAVGNYEEEITRAQNKERLPPGVSLDSRIRSLRLGMAGCYDTLGWIHQQRGRFDQAAQSWYLAMSQTTDGEVELRAKFHYEIGLALIGQRQTEGARESLARARSLTASSELLGKIAAAEKLLTAAPR
ncbi:MAG: tetratricopeptide repeat protein [Planctomycetes bacterium]|nr:tetratricopeptide repeat protein [Planctomycetota bacterium]